MITPRVPLHLSHSPTPSISAFAFLASLEAGVRGILLSVMPLAIYREVGDAALVSRLYFMVGIVSLIAGLWSCGATSSRARPRTASAA